MSLRATKRVRILVSQLVMLGSANLALAQDYVTGDEHVDEHVTLPFYTNESSFLEVPSDNCRLSLDDLLHVCDDVNQEITEVCFQVLTEYFERDPIWLLWRFTWERGVAGHDDDELSLLNDRGLELEYAFDDYLISEVPTWRDIFDNKFEQRNRLV